MEKNKSKKQFQAPEANGHADNIDVEQVDLHSQKKKKKKNKEKKENYEEINYSEVEESLSKKKKKKREQQDVEESPRKKKKSSKEDENSILQTSAQNVNSLEGTQRSLKTKKEIIEMETEESVIDDEWWSPEERKAMLEAMKVQIPVTGRFTRVGYLSLLRKTNWEDVMGAVNSRTQGGQSRNKEQCQDQFHKLLNKVGTIKSLNQILDEALNLASDPSALRREVTQARHRFIKDYMLRNKGAEDCSIMVATRLWTNLPAGEKEKWEEEYQNELRQKGLLDAKSKPKKLRGPQNCQYPWECFQKARSAKGEVLISSDAKTKYSSMSLKKRIPFIVESLKQQKVYEAEAEKYLENNPTYKKTKAHGPIVKEIKDYLESLGMPLNPPNTVIGMFYAEEKEKFTEDNENDSQKVRSVNESLRPFSRAREALSKLPQVQQDRYKSEWRKSWTEYVSEVEKWKPMIAEKYPEILDHALTALSEVKAPKGVNETNSGPTVRKKAADPFPNIERRTSSLTDVKFTDEPPLPARTAYELFQQKFKRDAGANYNSAKAKEFWGRMNDDKKAVYTERVKVLQQRSKNNFLTFARNLEKQQRKLFVGTRRAKVLKYFQEDIFAEEYPGASYPILIATPRKGSTAQEMDNSEDDFQPSKSSNSMKGGIKALAAKMKNDTIKEESSAEENSDDEDENEDKDEEEEDEEEDEEEAKEEKDSSSSDSDSSDSDTESNSEVDASQPTPVSPFSLAKSNKNSLSVSNVANSSPFSGKQQSKEESSDSGSDSDEESDSDDNKENYETPVSSRAQSKTKQRSIVGATSTPAIKEENSSDSESSSPSSSDSEDDITPAWKNTSVAATPNSKSAGSAVKEDSSDESSEEESEESD